jgi:hypothetical protein
VPHRVKDSPYSERQFWAVTSYFNPAGYRNRLKNYLIFRQRLTIPLLTVELSYGDDFELGEGDADVLVRIRGHDALWQKERLLNLALEALPPRCEQVAWIDCDVVFDRADWPAVAGQLLKDVPLVQLFQVRCNLPAELSPEQADARAHDATRTAIAYKVVHGMVQPQVVGEAGCVARYGIALGLAWAAPRRLLETHGLYDAGILGGGDRALACAAFGQFDGLREPWVANQRQMDHFRTWAEPFHAAVRGKVGYVQGTAFHLWHGERDDRRYVERYAGLREFGFDPSRDIAVDSTGCWRWNTSKPAMHRYVSDYFRARREDG